MATDITLTSDEYEALRYLALQQVEATRSTNLLAMLREIDVRNEQERDFLWIRWADAQNSGVYPSSDFPRVWPPEFEAYLEVKGRPVSRADVMEAIQKAGAGVPAKILATRDYNKLVGWSTLDHLFP